jgi:hypothetical protein
MSIADRIRHSSKKFRRLESTTGLLTPLLNERIIAKSLIEFR